MQKYRKKHFNHLYGLKNQKNIKNGRLKAFHGLHVRGKSDITLTRVHQSDSNGCADNLMDIYYTPTIQNLTFSNCFPLR